jgi:hypothetical protein
MNLRDQIKLDPDVAFAVFQSIGKAIWHAQHFEGAISGFIVLCLKLPPSRDAAEIDEVVESLDKKTMGALIAELRCGRKNAATSEFEQRVYRLLDERNWLVHKSLQTNGNDIYDETKALTLIQRIEAFADECLALQTAFGEHVIVWMESQGFTREEIDAEALERLKDNGAAK